jgi:hypothetical protein
LTRLTPAFVPVAPPVESRKNWSSSIATAETIARDVVKLKMVTPLVGAFLAIS